MLFQNNVPIDLACHSSILNMQSVLEIRITLHQTSHPELQKRCRSMMFVLLVVTSTWRSPYESSARIRLQAKPGLVGSHHASPLLRYPRCMLSTPG
ncbi:uncharacterized protein TNCV_3752471 [Trichonephila clavipes]|nr:uncharacterized protein TNCV_3752471 [Trichonephila clavipes]